MDRMSRQARSLHMSRIGPKDTRPEMIVRSGLHRAGFRFRLHRRELPGRPDIVLPRHNAVIFVHGCFWHSHPGCRLAAVPGTRREFWIPKLAANRERDRRQVAELRRQGWRVLIIWECSVRPASLRIATIAAATMWIRDDSSFEEITGPMERHPDRLGTAGAACDDRQRKP